MPFIMNSAHLTEIMKDFKKEAEGCVSVNL